MKKMKRDRRQRRHSLPWQIILTVLVGLAWTLMCVLLTLGLWYDNTFDMEFAELLYSLMAPTGGTGSSTLTDIFNACIPPTVVLILVFVAGALLLSAQNRLCKLLRRVGAVACLIGLLCSTVWAVNVARLPRYVQTKLGHTMIYDDYYIDPETVNIYDTDGNKKNIIYIYLESMETTYASRDVGGAQPTNNYIPNLTTLAQDENNTTFSDGEGLGGFHSITGTAWTMGSLLSTTSGIPFSEAVFGEGTGNSQGKLGTFLNRLTSLGDILEKEGYRQEFLCGSDASFAGRDTYFQQHGNYEIYDLYSARKDGYISKDYYVWWGYEDAILFEIAKDEVTELAAGEEPFNFTMLTVDTHHVGGYRCASCGNDYATNLENVVACADTLVADFLSWCEEQPFYEDTVIIVTGDHPRMDKQLVDETSFYDRTIYNCFINAEVDAVNTKNRTFTSMDIFPTVLAAMGYTIEGDRLGLGTNLFSDKKTLAEELGYDYLEEELSRYSAYYLNFI